MQPSMKETIKTKNRHNGLIESDLYESFATIDWKVTVSKLFEHDYFDYKKTLTLKVGTFCMLHEWGGWLCLQLQDNPKWL